MNDWINSIRLITAFVLVSNLFISFADRELFGSDNLQWKGIFLLMDTTLGLKIYVSPSEVHEVLDSQEHRLRDWGVPSWTNTSLQASGVTTGHFSLGLSPGPGTDILSPSATTGQARRTSPSVIRTSCIFVQFQSSYFTSLYINFCGSSTFKFVSFFLITKETHHK